MSVDELNRVTEQQYMSTSRHAVPLTQFKMEALHNSTSMHFVSLYQIRRSMLLEQNLMVKSTLRSTNVYGHISSANMSHKDQRRERQAELEVVRWQASDVIEGRSVHLSPFHDGMG